MNKVVVLNSGGFDSIVLLNHIYQEYSEDHEVVSLHFCYGERNSKQQVSCVNEVCEKLGIDNIVIDLPKISWTARDFYGESCSLESQYLEYRNLIFLSYALSLAQSIGADKVFTAFVGNTTYPDTSQTFLDGLNHFSKELTNIEVIAPYLGVDKYDLIYYANKYGVSVGDYFSCDVPVNGEPCGVCGDCVAIKEIEEVLTIDHPHKVLVRNGFNYNDPKFVYMCQRIPVSEIRLLINNSCQLKCEHCFYGFKDTLSPVLPKEELFEVLREAHSLGITNVHFSGKEPLFNDDILWYAQKISEEIPSMSFDVVTNGINVPKYAEQLKKFGMSKVFLSVDDVLVDGGLRKVKGVTERALQACEKAGLEVEIFIDLHEGNTCRVYDIIHSLVSRYFCVKSFYVRTIKNLGCASDFPLLSLDDLLHVYSSILKSAEENPDVFFHYRIGSEYESLIFSKDSELKEIVDLTDYLFTRYVLSNFTLNLEDSCSRYTTQITISPDGYAFGCGVELSVKDYDSVSVGNIRDHSLKELIDLGKKEVCGVCNKNFSNKKTCSFLETT